MIQFDETFFEPEIREGFYVSRMMKRLWAAQMIVLAEIDRVCSKHQILWFADNGTLLGAVRHKGYIPWDDDMDICMLREDYDRFLEIAAGELPEGYVIRNIHTDPDCLDLTTRILNSDSIRLDSEYLTRNAGFPYVAGVDIFPLDALSEDEEEERLRCEQIKEITRLGELLINSPDAGETEDLLKKVQKEHHVKFRDGRLSTELNLLLESLYSRFSGKKTPFVALIHYWAENMQNHRYERRMFDMRLTLPFENMRLYVPGMYEEVLRIEYGDYMRIVRKWDLHTFPIYAPQEKQLEEACHGRNPLKYGFMHELQNAGVRMPENGSEEKTQKIVTDPLLGFDPYRGFRANTNPAAERGEKEELVLIPSLLPELNGEWNDKLAIAMEEQIFSPMVLAADKVILPDEDLRRFYLDRLNGAAPKIRWEEKFFTEAPGEKASAGERPGVKKLLYYTGYSSMLRYGEEMIDKIRSVLALLSENAESISCLWLPQLLLPGEEENMMTVRREQPDLFIKWTKLFNEYESILTVDPDQAITRCEAFYGDAGYIAHRFRVLGKPVMIQNVAIR